MQTNAALPAASGIRRFLEVVRLRYVLQWAQIRSSAWRIIWFGLVHAVLLTAAVLFGVFGLGSLIAAVQGGQATPTVQRTLAAVFLNAVIASLILGFGLGAVFSDRSLRRYPFTARQRFFIRHLLGLFEPLWLITLAAYAGAAVAAVALGLASLVEATAAALLLMLANYVLVRVALGVGTLLLETTAGSLLLFAALQSLFLIPMGIGRLVRSEERREALAGLFAHTPPAAAGSLLTGSGTIIEAVTLLAWCVIGLAALAALEGRGERSTAAAAARATWNRPLDRMTSWLPDTWGPLILRGLRFFLRSHQVRIALLTMLPFVMLWPRMTRFGRTGSGSSFELTLLLMPVLGSVTSSMLGNAFGFDGGGTRRLLLTPVGPLRLLGGTLGASLIICAGYVMLATTVAMILLGGGSIAAAMLLLTHGLSGMFIYHIFAVWTSVLAPFRGNYDEKFRRQSGGFAQLVMLVFVAFLGASVVVRRVLLDGPITTYWWLSTLFMLLLAVLFLVCLRMAAPVLMRRREQLLAVVEGRG